MCAGSANTVILQQGAELPCISSAVQAFAVSAGYVLQIRALSCAFLFYTIILQ